MDSKLRYGPPSVPAPEDSQPGPESPARPGFFASEALKPHLRRLAAWSAGSARRGALAGLLWGFAEGGVQALRIGTLADAPLSMLLAGILVAPYGVPAAWFTEGIILPLLTRLGRDAAEAKTGGARIAGGLGIGLGVVILLTGVALLVDMSADLQVLSFAQQASVLLMACALLAAACGYVAIQWLRESVAAHWSLSERKRRALVVSMRLSVWAIAFSLLVAFAAVSDEHLGSLVWLVMLWAVGITIAAWAPAGSVPERVRGSHLAIEASLFACALLAVGLFGPKARTAFGIVSDSAGAGSLLALFDTLSDLDRDGNGSLFGGTDCAPWDSKRGPHASEIAGNSSDENCDGIAEKEGTKAGQRPAASGLVPRRYQKRYNVVLMIVDALRADRVGALGNRHRLTPNIDRLAKDSWVFEDAYSQSSSTRISVPSLMTGRHPDSITWSRPSKKLPAQPVPGMLRLAEAMATEGYQTGMIENGWMRRNTPLVFQGFDFKQSLQQRFNKPRAGAAAQTTAAATSFINRRNSRRPFLLTVYYDGPHAPYHDLTAYGEKPRSKQEIHRYESEIRYTDRHVGALIDFLQADQRLWGNTMVILTADHGEEFGEHGQSHHSRTCYIEVIHVPLILRVPGLRPGRSSAPTALIDVVPTVSDFTGVPFKAHMDGQSLAYPIFGSPEEMRVRTCMIFPRNGHPRHKALRRIDKGGWLLIEKLGNDPNLFDTGDDPGEQQDLFDQPQAAAKLKEMRELLELHKQANVAK